ncbi:carbohydrate ABC transporter permease [Cryptosporangium sp. NPDC051539]|uniref:carbohydrate ABC transporter permease n=1 Tax=Cryptosporangium sp. NPDC051539 TaxID=3363962 RepID=UPI0037A4F447
MRRRLTTLGFLSPLLLGFLLFFVYPLCATVLYSFEHYDQINPPQWVGLQNWVYVFTQNGDFWPAVRNTVWLVVVMVSLRVIFGIGVGLLVTRVRRGRGLYRTIFYLPYLAPPVAATLVFVYVLNPNGPVDRLLRAVGLPAPSWFNDPNWSKPALVLLSLWGIGDLMVIFMAALLQVPVEQYEAAQLDGAGAIRRFRHITLPNIQPIILFSSVTGVIAALQYYTQAFVAGQVASGVVTGGGTVVEPGYPGGSTLTLPQLIYSLGFQHFDTGAASAIAVVLFVVAMACTFVLVRGSGGLVSTRR